ncbi:MAG: HAD family hydrolase [Christensenellales bacterium]
MAVKNLVLDMGNVLLAWAPMDLARMAAENEEDAKILNSALFDTPQWGMMDAGQIEEAELLRAALGRAPERLHEALRRLLDNWSAGMAPIPGADDFTRRAKEAGLKLYLLSNASKRFPGVLSSQPFYPRFDGMMVSAHEKMTKPDPRIYRLLCRRFSLVPQECLFVDDMAVNVKGAEQVGMAAVHFEGDYRKVEDRLRELGVVLG